MGNWKDYGTARVSERRAFRTRPWHRPVRERRSELLRTPLHWSRDSACCRGAPTGGDWDYPGLNGSRRGCCKLSRHSAKALVCRRLLPRGAHDWSEREQQARSTRGTNKPPASSSVPVPGASHPGRRAVGSFRFLLVVPCRRQLLAEGRHMHFWSHEVPREPLPAYGTSLSECVLDPTRFCSASELPEPRP